MQLFAVQRYFLYWFNLVSYHFSLNRLVSNKRGACALGLGCPVIDLANGSGEVI